MSVVPSTHPSDGSIPEIKAPWGAVIAALTLGVFASIFMLGRRVAHRTNPERRWGAAQRAPLGLFLPSRLGDAGELLGIPRVAVWTWFGLLLVGCGISFFALSS